MTSTARTTLTLLSWFVALRCLSAAPCTPPPLAVPTFEVSGLPKSDVRGLFRGAGTLAALSRASEGGVRKLELRLAGGGTASVAFQLPEPVDLDVAQGADVEVAFWDVQGFEGQARGLRIRDGRGIVLLADDGDYGNAVPPEERRPFRFTQEDAGCRDRKNAPGDLNGFRLVVAAGGKPLALMQGEEGELVVGDDRYRVIAVRSSSRVDDVQWTDAPYEVVSYVVARIPSR